MFGEYHSYPKFLDKQAWANSANPDQAAPSPVVLEKQSDHSRHCLPYHLHLLDNFSKERLLCLNFRMITANILGNFGCPKNKTFMVVATNFKYKWGLFSFVH